MPIFGNQLPDRVCRNDGKIQFQELGIVNRGVLFVRVNNAVVITIVFG